MWASSLFTSHLFCAAVRQLFFDTERRMYAVQFTCVSLIECLLRLTCVNTKQNVLWHHWKIAGKFTKQTILWHVIKKWPESCNYPANCVTSLNNRLVKITRQNVVKVFLVRLPLLKWLIRHHCHEARPNCSGWQLTEASLGWKSGPEIIIIIATVVSSFWLMTSCVRK